MLDTKYPDVFDRLLGTRLAGGARYLELSRRANGFHLRALVANAWKEVPVEEGDAERIWNWATGRIQARRMTTTDSGRAGRSPAIELVGRLGGERRVSRLKLRLRARPLEQARDGGTLTMRMTDLVAPDHP